MIKLDNRQMLVTWLLGHIGPLDGQQHVAPGLLDEANSLIDIGRHLVVDLEDLVILPEPSPLALATRHDLGDKHANLILSVAIQASVDQGQAKTLGSPLDPDVLSPHGISTLSTGQGDNNTVREILDHNIRKLFPLASAQGSQVVLF